MIDFAKLRWNVTISNWSSNGYTANILDGTGLVAKIPAKTWRSEEQIRELANRIAGVRALEAGIIAVLDWHSRAGEAAGDAGCDYLNDHGGWSDLEKLAAELRLMVSPTDKSVDCRAFQGRTGEWMLKCFGGAITDDLQERCYRFFEEAGELCQALGMTADMAHQLVDYTWNRDAGQPGQEVGGVMLTLAALCFAARIDMEAAAEAELARVNAPEVMEKIRRKHADKVLRTPLSPLPGQVQ